MRIWVHHLRREAFFQLVLCLADLFRAYLWTSLILFQLMLDLADLLHLILDLADFFQLILDLAEFGSTSFGQQSSVVPLRVQIVTTDTK